MYKHWHRMGFRSGWYTTTLNYSKYMHYIFQRRKLGPGSYHVDVGGFSPKAVFERAIGPGWERSYETSNMAKIPHLLYKEQWKKKQLQVGVS